MALHIREQITAAVAAAVTGLATTGARVYRARDRALQDADLPGLIVRGMGEAVDISSLGINRLLDRTMRVEIAAHVKASSGYDTTLNQVLKEIEVALVSANLSGGKYISPIEIGDPEISEEAEKPVARQIFVFEVPYFTQAGIPDVAL